MELDNRLNEFRQKRLLYRFDAMKFLMYNVHFFPSVASVSFIHLLVCLTTGPKPPPKRAVYIVRSRASSFK